MTRGPAAVGGHEHRAGGAVDPQRTWPSLHRTNPSPLRVCRHLGSSSPSTTTSTAACGTPNRQWRGAVAEAHAADGPARCDTADGGLDAGEVHAEADVRSGGEGEVATDVRTAEQESVGSGNSIGSRLARRARRRRDRATFDRPAAQRHITRGVAVDASGRGGLHPQRLLDGHVHVRWGVDDGRPRGVSRSTYHNTLRIMPSVVSMPPNMIDRRVRHHSSSASPRRGRRRPDVIADRVAASPPPPRRSARSPRRHALDRGHDVGYQPTDRATHAGRYRRARATRRRRPRRADRRGRGAGRRAAPPPRRGDESPEIAVDAAP